MLIYNKALVELIEKEITKQKAAGKNVTREALVIGLGLPKDDPIWQTLVSQIIYFQSTKFESAKKAGFVPAKSKSIIEFPGEEPITIADTFDCVDEPKVEPEADEPAPETLRSTPFSIKPPPITEVAPVVEIKSAPISNPPPAPFVFEDIATEIFGNEGTKVEDISLLIETSSTPLTSKEKQREAMREKDEVTGLPKWALEDVPPIAGIMERPARNK